MVKFIEKPRVEKNPNEKAPLVAMVYFKVDDSVSTTLNVDDGRQQRVVTYGTENSPEHGLPIIGMRANTEHRITVTITTEDSTSHLIPLS